MTRMTPMMKMIARWGMVVVLGALAGTAFAQSGAGSAPVAVPAGSGAAAPAAPAADAPPAPGPAPATPQETADARKVCTRAMNADPQFAADMIKTLHDIERTAGSPLATEIIATVHDMDTVKVHQDAEAHVQKNERHVIYAYAAMWIVAALFVIFLWRRQQALQAEIAILRRDLEAAAGEATADKARS